MMDKTYIEIVRLLLESAPAIFETPHFAMKGGTAINLFIEDMPRLSVDIDVVYTDHQASRDEALKSISRGLAAARKRLVSVGIEAEISATKDGDEIKLFIRQGRNQVKLHVRRYSIVDFEVGRGARPIAPELCMHRSDIKLPMLVIHRLRIVGDEGRTAKGSPHDPQAEDGPKSKGWQAGVTHY